MADSYTVGDLVRLQGSLTDSASVAIDPTALTVKVKSPNGTLTTYTYPATVSTSGTGVYYVDVTPTSDGTWHYRFASTGTGQAAQESFFRVADSNFD